MGNGVYAQGQAADDGDAIGSQIATEAVGNLAPVNRGAARADDANGPTVVGLERATHIDKRWRGINLAQVLWIFIVVQSQYVHTRLEYALPFCFEIEIAARLE
jgi:hypothetical protein